MHKPLRVIPIVAAPAIAPPDRIQVRSVSGFFSRWRWAMVWATQLVFYGLPWLQMHGRQAVLFDLQARRFHLFGAVLLPQDLIFLTGLLIFSALLLFLATVVAGRVWCGFACPQTVYTEMFMWIERRLEGNRASRIRLDQSPWRGSKLVRRGSKHLAWALLSLWTGLTLVGWFTPIHDLVAALPALSFGPWEAFWILFYGGVTYVHAGLLREKICQHACPYGRFQSSLLDRHTLVVAYDSARGEPRGARARGQQASALHQGDCVDCTLCVQVCPTGIDIRHGLQAACISCGLCIDACDAVMDKLRAPRGLIGFSPLEPAAVAPGWTAPLRRGRVRFYALALLGLALLMTVGWWERPTLRVNALRDRGVLARHLHAGRVENVYRLQIMNASEHPHQLALAVQADSGSAPVRLHLVHEGPVQLEGAGAVNVAVSVQMDAEDAQRLQGTVLPIRFMVMPNGTDHQAASADSTFLVR